MVPHPWFYKLKLESDFETESDFVRYWFICASCTMIVIKFLHYMQLVCDWVQV